MAAAIATRMTQTMANAQAFFSARHSPDVDPEQASEEPERQKDACDQGRQSVWAPLDLRSWHGCMSITGSRTSCPDYLFPRLAELDRLVRDTPQDYGWPRPTWTRELLVATLRQRIGVRMHVATMS